MRITSSDVSPASHYQHVGHDRVDRGGAELSRLDTDHDGWLDEDDVPYDELKLRAPAHDGSQSLKSVHAARQLDVLA